MNQWLIFSFPTLNDEQTVTDAERNALYYIFGYCVKSLERKMEICDVCANALVSGGGSVYHVAISYLKILISNF